MSNSAIRETFDRNPNMTVAQLARMFGKTVDEIKAILMASK